MLKWNKIIFFEDCIEYLGLVSKPIITAISTVAIHTMH